MAIASQKPQEASEPPCFSIGQVVATPGVCALIQRRVIDPMTYLRRHMHGDWGDLPSEDANLNNRGLETGGRLFSAYEIDSLRLWIITEWDRSVTTLLLPSEY